jgi:hypothetical protein
VTRQLRAIYRDWQSRVLGTPTPTQTAPNQTAEPLAQIIQYVTIMPSHRFNETCLNKIDTTPFQGPAPRSTDNRPTRRNLSIPVNKLTILAFIGTVLSRDEK